MEHKYLKDFVISIGVLLILAYGTMSYFLFNKVKNIPKESVYKNVALKKNLLDKINKIDLSIKDRKSFVFSVTRDPLEQHLIVKTKKDLEKQWREEVENMVRLEYTMIAEEGLKMASVAYKGKSNLYKIGDSFFHGKIVDVQSSKLIYTYYDKKKVMNLTKIPPKPIELQKNFKPNKNNEYNW